MTFRFDGQNFALCGKTIESLRRNVTTNLPTWLAGRFLSGNTAPKTRSW